MDNIHTLKEPPFKSMHPRYPRPIVYSIDPQTRCWNVVSHVLHSDHYIHVMRNRRLMLGHRYSYELAYGPIPDGLFVLHRCDNPICINPTHLFLGTQKDNLQDMTQKGRRVHLHGEANGRHKLTVANVQIIQADKISTRSDLGEKYGVGQAQIGRIKRGESWAHVTCPSEISV